MNDNWPRYFYLRTEEHRYEEIAGYCIGTKPCEGCDICQEEYGYQRRFYQPKFDQTLHHVSESAIEFIVRRRTEEEIARKGRYP